MTTLTWVGGGNNRANNPQDWSPAQSPSLGDTLIMPDGGTMNIVDNGLAGNQLQVGSTQASGLITSTLNLSHHAVVSVNQPQFTNGSWTTDLNIRGSAALTIDAPLGTAPVNDREFNVNLSHNANVTSSFDLNFSTLNVAGHGELTNNGQVGLAATHAVIDSNVVGSGSFDLLSLPSFMGLDAIGFLEFGGSVSRDQTVTLGGASHSFVEQWDTLQVDEPKKFHASVMMQQHAEVELVGLLRATSYTFDNDLLKIFSDNKVIDDVHLTNQASTFEVSSDGSNVYLTQPGFSESPSSATPLPLHMGSV